MGSYLVKRILLFIPTLVMVSLIVFFLMRVIPGDPALVLLMGDSGEGRFTEEDLAAVRHKLGTDRPLLVQYSTWALGMLKGDMGVSMYYQEPVIQELRRRVPITLQLATMAILISFIISVPLGVLTAVRQDTWVDHVGKIFTILGITLPTFWVGILVVFFLSALFNWLPPLGYATLWDDPLTNLQQLIFPALALGYFNTAFSARVTRSSMLEVLREDYIRTARSKGLHEFMIIGRHALKNAFLPVITVSGWQFSRLLGGSIIIEIVFLVPGLGNILVDSVVHRDFTFIQAIIMLTAGMVLTLNLIIDLAYGWLNPRLRYE